MRRIFAATVGVGMATALLVLAPQSARADDVGSGHVTDYDVEVVVRGDGVLDVHERISYVFDDTGHGIIRSIPYRYRYDDTHDREAELGPVTVTSATAPVEVDSTREDGHLVLRIGDPDRLIQGDHTYELDYTVSGALTERDGHVELAWNGVGDRWETPIEQATTTVRAPALRRAWCYYGPAGSDDSCGSTGPDGVSVEAEESTVEFGPVGLEANEAMTVYAELPPGSVEVAPPVLVERWTARRAFSVTPLTVGLALGLVALGTVAVWRLAVRRGRDEQSVTALHGTAGAPPGVGVPVDWRAVREMRPGVLGTLVDEKADVVDVTATVVDLAVRRHLRIEEVGSGKDPDWRLVRLEGTPDDLLPYERALRDELFRDGPDVRVRDLEDHFHEQMSSVRNQLYGEVVRRGWYRVRPDRTRYLWYGIAAVAVGAAAGVAALLIAFTTFGLVGVALVLPAIGLLLAARSMPARTPQGSAALAQVQALRHYLSTATPTSGQWDEGEQTFSDLFPYAMVLGLERRWTDAFAPLAARPHGATSGPRTYAPYWYVGVPAGLYAGGLDDFGSRLTSFASMAGSAMSSSPSDSGSGAGGFSGGGAGGGGGGGW